MTDVTSNGVSSSAVNQELSEKVLQLKESGNQALVEGHFLQAIGFYSDALDLLKEPNAIILSNRAQAYIKVENYGLAIADSTLAIETDPTYPKGYYRRGTAEFALNNVKAAKKDFKKVCTLRPKDRDARLRFSECDKLIKEAAFAAAIGTKETIPLSESYDPNELHIPDSYDGPHPSGECLTNGDLDKEDSFFEPGQLPHEFVMVSIIAF
jgi:serine/threonine-protein phosphatase 5